MSALNGQPIGKVTLAMPRYGSWRADVLLTQGEPPTEGAATTLVVGDLTLAGTVLRSGLDAPGQPHATVVGAPGWERAITAPLSFRSDVEVRLSTVLKDLAKLAGETIEQPTERTIAQHFTAIANKTQARLRIRDVLAALYRAGYVEPWRVDADGVTRFGARVGTEATGRATKLRARADLGQVVYGVDAPAQFIPGNTVEGETIERLVVRETAGKLEAEVWTNANTPGASLLRMVASAFPQLTYGYPRTYVVVTANADGTLDLAPAADAPELPELRAVEQWGLGGAVVTPQAGAEVLVLFRDADPSRPIATSWGTLPADLVEFTGGSEVVPPGDELGRFVRWGDAMVFSAPGPGTMTLVPGSPVGKVSG